MIVALLATILMATCSANPQGAAPCEWKFPPGSAHQWPNMQYQNQWEPEAPKCLHHGVPVPMNHYIPCVQQVPCPVEKPVPYYVTVKKECPYPVPLPKPYPVPVNHYIKVPVDKPVPCPIPYPVIQRVPVGVPQAYPCYIERPVPVPVPQPCPYPVPVLCNKIIPLIIQKGIPIPISVPQPYPVPNPYPVPSCHDEVSSPSNQPPYSGHFQHPPQQSNPSPCICHCPIIFNNSTNPASETE